MPLWQMMMFQTTCDFVNVLPEFLGVLWMFITLSSEEVIFQAARESQLASLRKWQKWSRRCTSPGFFFNCRWAASRQCWSCLSWGRGGGGLTKDRDAYSERVWSYRGNASSEAHASVSRTERNFSVQLVHMASTFCCASGGTGVHGLSFASRHKMPWSSRSIFRRSPVSDWTVVTLGVNEDL